MSLLEVRGLTRAFGGLVAVSRLNLLVEPGEIVGVIGPNGAGKTTLFALISGFVRPNGGTVRFDGRDVTGWRPNRVCRLGLARTFQIVRPFPDVSVLENVMVGAHARTASTREAEEQAIAVLELVGLAHRGAQLAGTLTLADRKRLELARALATDPKLLLLDEVMAGLNPRETADTLEIVREVRRRGVTLLIVEHVMHVIMTLAERVVVLHHGEKIAEGTPAEISRDQRVIDAYLGAAPGNA